MQDEPKPGAEGPQGNPPAPVVVENPDRPAPVEGAGSAPSGNNGDGRGKEPDWKNKYFAQERLLEKQRKRIDELDQWRSQFNTPAQTTVAPNPDEELANHWNDPIGSTRQIVKSVLQGELSQELSKERLAQGQAQAEAYILSQDYVDPDADADTFRSIMEEHGLMPAWNNDPFKTAKAILKIFKSERGISDKKTPPKAQAGSVLSGSGPSAASNGKKIWTSKEIRAMTLEAYKEKQADIETARQEGRIQGD